jgi:hypothetical protein
MNKLQYDIIMHANGARTANWNQRPRDAANFAKWAGPQVEQFLNWQVVNLSVPVSDLHDAPILYIAGNQALDFTDAEMAKLRQFVEEGGLIFANADCGSLLFSAAMHKIAHKLFPAYEFRTLPASSSIYTDEQFTRAKWSSHPALEALSNGARELIILAPANDPSRFWQTQTYRGRESMYQFMQDIFLYTVDRGEKGALRFKGDTYVVSADPNIHPGKHLKVARLQYPGNWDPEPGAWRRLAAILHNTDDTEVDVQPVNLGDSKLDNSYKVAHLTGTFKFSLAPASRAEIKKYVEGGGTLILDSCGGDASCAESLEKELAAIFPDAKLATAPLPPDSPAYAVGPKLAPVEYRPIERKIVGKLHTPRVRGLEINGRLGVFLSSEDLTCGMVGMPFDGIYGYEPDSATSLMEKLVLFAGK